MIDSIDQLAGLEPDDPVYRARRFRPEFVDGAETCRRTVLAPKNDQGLAPGLRLAIAHRIALRNADAAIMADYAAQLENVEYSDGMLQLAQGSDDLPEPLATIARHVDLVTVTPRAADVSDIRRLEQAGLDNPAIVALSELIAFVNFQLRVVAGLRLLRSA